MELLTAALRASLPALYSQEGNPDPRVHGLCSTGHNAERF